MPNFSFEDFEELYRLKHQLAQGDQRPRYSIQQISASGTADATDAELTIQFRILVREEQWLRVPLHLDQAVLRQQPQYQGPGEQFLHFEGDSEGYVLWIRGPAGQATASHLEDAAAAGPRGRGNALEAAGRRARPPRN